MRRGQCTAGPGRESGLAVLEWLLILGAAAGLAAFSVLAVQRVLDRASEAPADPLVRLLDADIAAAFVATEGQSVFDDGQYDDATDSGFEQRCNDILAGSPDVVDSAVWVDPRGPDRLTGTDDTDDDDVAAACTVTPVAGLGG